MWSLALTASLLVGSASLSAIAEDPAATPGPSEPAAPSAPDRMDWWRDARFGMFIHWGLYAIPEGKWGSNDTYGEWVRHEAKIPVAEYDKLVTRFNPVKFDANTIVRAAKGAGMNYIVITSKHHDGFCLFDTKTTDFDVMSTPFKRDVMKEMADACRREGLKICWYYSIMDWHHPDYLPRRDWEKEADRPSDKADFDNYVTYMKAQLKELLTNYGDIGILWFDGQWEHNWNDQRGRDLEAYVRSLQPNIIINSRVGKGGGSWGMDGTRLGDYSTPEQHIPDFAPGGDWETCMTMNGHWGYNAADKNFKTDSDLIHKLVDISSKGGNFLLNIGPTALGEIPPESVSRLEAMGRWLSVYGDSIYGSQGGPFPKPFTWGRCTLKPEGAHGGPGEPGLTRLFLHIFDWPADGKLVVPGIYNHVETAYWLADSQRALKFENLDDTIIVTLEDPPVMDPVDTVVVIDVHDTPDIAIAPTITPGKGVGLARPGQWQFVDAMDVTLGSPRQRVDVRYTLDGSDPSRTSPVATRAEPIKLAATTKLATRCFRGGQPVSPVATAVFTKVTPRQPVQPEQTVKPGLRYEYIELPGDIKSLSEIKSGKVVAKGHSPTPDIAIRKRDKNWAGVWTGLIDIPATGIYQFTTGSDDGSRLSIGDTLIVDNDKPHSYEEITGSAALAKGLHPIKIEFFENWGGFDLKVFWAGPGMTKQQIPAAAFKHE